LKFEPNELLPGLLRHHLHLCLEALCAEPQFILGLAFARALPLLSTILAPRRSTLAGSPRKRPQRPPSSAWISKATSSSDTGQNLRRGSECPGRVLGLALGLRWRAGAKTTAAQKHNKAKNGSVGPPWLACPRGWACNPGVLNCVLSDLNLLIRAISILRISLIIM
jgi:hypothetical protein